METIFWLVVLYFVGRRWWKKNPAKAAELKKALQEIHANHPASGTKNTAPRNKPETPRPAASFTAAKPASAPKPQPVLTHRKKAEKQFQEL